MKTSIDGAILIKVEVIAGSHISMACEAVKKLSKQISKEIEFVFNGVVIKTENRTVEEMVKFYFNSFSLQNPINPVR